MLFIINPIRHGGGVGGVEKRPPTSFSTVTSTNVKLSLQNFLTFSFNLFDRLVLNLKLLNFNQDHLSKKAVFLVKSLIKLWL